MYCTLAEAKAELNADLTTDDAQIMALVRQVGARIDSLMASFVPVFEPVIEAREFEIDAYNVDSSRNVFILPPTDILLAIDTISLGTTTLSGVDAYPSTRNPIRRLRRTDGCSWYACVSNCDPLTTIVYGVWGYHRRYASAWLAVDALAAAIVNTTATTFTVADVDGANAQGYSPRISAGNLLKVDSEYMEVTATNITTNVITVIRGANGSTAAAHLIAAPVSVWQVEDNIKRVTARQAGLLYARRGAFETANITEIGIIQYPVDLLAELRGVVQGYGYI
jgi:hypothetical protein